MPENKDTSAALLVGGLVKELSVIDTAEILEKDVNFSQNLNPGLKNISSVNL